MRILCSKYGWDTTGEAVTTTVSGTNKNKKHKKINIIKLSQEEKILSCGRWRENASKKSKPCPPFHIEAILTTMYFNVQFENKQGVLKFWYILYLAFLRLNWFELKTLINYNNLIIHL